MDNKRFLLAEVKDGGEEAGPGTFHSILSAPTLDRDKEILDSLCFAPLPEDIPIHPYHSFDDPIARAVPTYNADGVLEVRGYYASTPRAQEIRTLVREGIIKNMSVGFMDANREVGEDGITHITKGEVLEGSFVSVPSNRESAVLMAKNYRDLALDAASTKVGARNSADDAARMQAIHDLSTELGSKCAPILEVLAEDEAETKRAQGGPVESGRLYLIGEKGDEFALRAEQAQMDLDVKTKGEENSDGPVMAPAEQARLAIARAEADLLLT